MTPSSTASARTAHRGPDRGLDVVPSAIALAGAEVELAAIDGRERRLRRLLGPLDRYDVISHRLPAVTRALTVNALTAADAVLIPLQCEYYALEGLTQLLATIDLVRDHLNPASPRRGRADHVDAGRTCPRMSRPRPPPSRRLVYETVDPAQRPPVEAPSHGLPDPAYAPDSTRRDGYAALADEFRGRAGCPAADETRRRRRGLCA
jgi:chromosome partitioning protein